MTNGDDNDGDADIKEEDDVMLMLRTEMVIVAGGRW